MTSSRRISFREKANYVALIEHEGAKTIWQKDTKFALFTGDGDAIKSDSARTIGGAVKESCEALLKNWSDKSASANEKK